MKPGRPKKTEDEKRVVIAPRVNPLWLKKFRKWSKTQPDSQGLQIEEGVNLLIEKRENEGSED